MGWNKLIVLPGHTGWVKKDVKGSVILIFFKISHENGLLSFMQRFKGRHLIVIFIILLIITQVPTLAQDSINLGKSGNKGKTSNIGNFGILRPLPVTGIVLLSYSAGLIYIGTGYYPDDSRVPFYFTNDCRSYLQMDKFHHAFMSNTISYFGYKYLINAGIKKNKALLFGGGLGFLLLTPKEIVDGHLKDAGFSWRDITANFVGSLVMTGQELFFDEQVVKYKFSYWRSDYAKMGNGLLGRNFIHSYIKDYNGHTYWLSINANRLALKNKIPDWINIAVGYSANGMYGPYENRLSYNGVAIPETSRYRQFLLSLDVDWPEIKTRSKFLKTILNSIVFIKLPFPAVEVNSKGRVKGYWIYF